MNIKRAFLATMLVLLTLGSAACSSQPAVYAEGDQKDQAVAAADPAAEDILNGMQKSDYELFHKDFDDTMLKSLTEDSFNKMVAQFSAYGAFKSKELINVQVVSTYYRVNYKLTYENKVLTMGVVIPQSGDAKVSGLWFK